MKCTRVSVDGMAAIVCGTERRMSRKCEHPSGCTASAVKLCDWKIGKLTCDALMCEAHAFSPADGKDLCCWRHEAEYHAWVARRTARAQATNPTNDTGAST